MKEEKIITIDEDNNKYFIIRDLEFDNKELKKDEKKKNIIVFDFENFSKKFDCNKICEILSNFEPSGLKIINCFVKEPSDLCTKDKILNLDTLYISDELYSISPNLKILFSNIKVNSLILKKIKINSKKQLKNFLEFIIKVECQELFLEDIYIELLIKKDEKDDTYSQLSQYITFEKGTISIKVDEKKKEINSLKKLTMIDCPLFVIPNNFMEEIKDKDKKIILLDIDVDENSLLNSSIITRFKFKDGHLDICFDFDSYQLYEDINEDIKEDKKKGEYKEKDINDDYIRNLKYIFNTYIFKDNEYHKIIFKNFDTTKYEYITGENLTFIKEKNWILNNDEKHYKEDFEEKDRDINKKIEDNKDILSKVKELVFDNCSNHFIQLILKLINYSKNNLDLLKLKKCGKEHFELKSILNLKINKLILFDIPLIIDKFPEDKDITGEVEFLTIKIASLENYCKLNNLDYFKTIGFIVNLIKNKNYNKNLCFEMNALPIIMAYLISVEYNKDKEEKNIIPTFFNFFPKEDKESKEKDKDKEKEKEKNIQNIIEGKKNRENIIKKTFKIEEIKNKIIKLRKNYIKNKFENYEVLYGTTKIKGDKGKDEKTDFGTDMFNLDIDYKEFFNLNEINNIILENCLFTDYHNKNLKSEDIKETLLNLIENEKEKKIYTIDFKTLYEVLFKNKGFEDISFIIKYLETKFTTELSSELNEYLNKVEEFFKNFKNVFKYLKENLKVIKISINNIKERKELYIILKIYTFLKKNDNFQNKKYKHKDKEYQYNLPKESSELKKIIEDYYLKEKNENENDILSVINYYHKDNDEFNILGNYETKEKECEFDNFKFIILYKYEKPWYDFIMK